MSIENPDETAGVVSWTFHESKSLRGQVRQIVDDPAKPSWVEREFASVIEGRCPTHATPLFRLSACGWCDRCERGWAARTVAPEDSDRGWLGPKVVQWIYPAGLSAEDQATLANRRTG